VRAAVPPTPTSGQFGRRPTFGILSSFPPTPCGLATFTAALARGLTGKGSDVRVVRVADDGSLSSDRVIGDLVNGSPASVAASTDLLNQCDVALVQHEYGLFGGRDGDEVLSILGGLRVPSIVIAHTVLADPTPHQRDVLEAAAALADQVVVMSEAARVRLCTNFDVDPTRVVTIAHGAAIAASAATNTVAPIGAPGAPGAPPRRRGNPFGPVRSPIPSRPTLLTWGLIGPGKGIERMLDAMPSLHQLPMRPQYLVAGSTHPKVLAADGEAYRNARIEQARRLGVADSVRFDDDYRDLASLNALIASCAVVVLPYDSTDQVTSGVLVDAIAAGKPVVATAFPHAIELLSSGAGLVVRHDDPDAMASAVRRVLLEPGLADRMATEAKRIAPGLGWPVVAGAYLELADRLRSARRVLV
jgi:glycosyltransferase involved in cell wall biosynthesis